MKTQNTRGYRLFGTHSTKTTETTKETSMNKSNRKLQDRKRGHAIIMFALSMIFWLWSPANGIAATKLPNLTPHQPKGWSGPIVATIDKNGDVKIDIAFANIEKVNVNSTFYVSLLVDGKRAVKYTIKSLPGGNYMTSKGYNLGRMKAGRYTLELVVDSSGNIKESKETDNSWRAKLTIEDDDELFWPLPVKYDFDDITQYHGAKWVVNKNKKHVGIDISAPAGTSVYAAKDGVVSRVNDLGPDPQTGKSWGQYVIIAHEDDTWTTGYLHLKTSIKKGAKVLQGDTIGKVYSDHLHFSVRLAPTSSISPRGALPITKDGSSDPVYPEKFVDPLDFEFDID